MIIQCPAGSGKIRNVHSAPGASKPPLPLSSAPASPCLPPLPAPARLWPESPSLAHLGLRHPAGSNWGWEGTGRKRWAAGSQFPGETTGPAPRGFQEAATAAACIELFRRHPTPLLLLLSSQSVASMACTTRSCSSNMTQHQPTSCSWCDQLQISRRATWWRWFCLVRSSGHPRGGASVAGGGGGGPLGEVAEGRYDGACL